MSLASGNEAVVQTSVARARRPREILHPEAADDDLRDCIASARKLGVTDGRWHLGPVRIETRCVAETSTGTILQ